MAADSAVLDETNLISAAGLVPVMELAEQAGLSDLLDVHVRSGRHGLLPLRVVPPAGDAADQVLVAHGPCAVRATFRLP